MRAVKRKKKTTIKFYHPLVLRCFHDERSFLAATKIHVHPVLHKTLSHKSGGVDEGKKEALKLKHGLVSQSALRE